MIKMVWKLGATPFFLTSIYKRRYNPGNTLESVTVGNWHFSATELKQVEPG